MVCKISAMSLPGCVNTLWQLQGDLYFEDNIFNFISNFRWNLKWQSCFGCNTLRARQNGAPFKMIYSNKLSCMELFHYFFFKFDLSAFLNHDDVIKWKHFPRYWPFVRGIHRSLVNSPHKCQWRGALIFSLICLWINGWVNNREAGDLRRYRAHLTSP